MGKRKLKKTMNERESGGRVEKQPIWNCCEGSQVDQEMMRRAVIELVTVERMRL